MALGRSDDEEPVQGFSFDKGVEYLVNVSQEWRDERECVTCHTNGTYMALRPSLTRFLGKPNEQVREFFLKFFRRTKYPQMPIPG